MKMIYNAKYERRGAGGRGDKLSNINKIFLLLHTAKFYGWRNEKVFYARNRLSGGEREEGVFLVAIVATYGRAR